MARGKAAMSVDELAELTGVSRGTIYQAIRDTGEAIPGVPAIKVRSRIVVARKLVNQVLGLDDEVAS